MLGSMQTHRRAGADPPHAPRSAPRWLRRAAVAMSSVFGWMTLAALPAQCLAHPAPVLRDGVRLLTPAEMTRLVGAQVMGGHAASISPAAGDTFPWEGSAGKVNTGNGNKLTQIPLVGWTQRGGLPIAFTLAHNSQSAHNGELGYKWTQSYDLYLVSAYNDISGSNDLSVHWGDDQSYTFVNNGSNVFTAPTGIYDSLVKNVDNTFTLTTKNQVKYHFKTALYGDSITDENANSVSIAHNSGNYVTEYVNINETLF